jgi:glycosyltransferase involved in cell wall biosynthesis
MASKRTEGPDITILIPVYNEEKTLRTVLDSVSRINISRYEVIIVDDASNDRSPKIIKEFIDTFKSSNVKVLHFRHKVNMGKGAGIQTGMKHASGRYFIIQDADLEYDPRYIPKLLRFAMKNDLDAVYGSRFLGKIEGMARANYIANRFYNTLLRLLYGVKITDMHTCYKMVRTSLLKDVGMSANGFDYATELISKLLSRGVVVHELPINFKGRTKEEGKKIDVMDGVECLYKLIRFKYFGDDQIFKEKSTTAGRFLLVGLVGFVVNYVILVALTQFNTLGHIIAEIIAAIVALHVTFTLHDRWTYKIHTPPGMEAMNSWSRYISYVASNSFGSLMTVVAFGFLYQYFTRAAALILGAVIGMAWNYMMNTYFIWRSKRSGR